MTKTKISRIKLEQMIRESIKEALLEGDLGNGISALRQIELMVAGNTLEVIEKEIRKTIGLKDPSHMDQETATKYMNIVKEMNKQIRDVVESAVTLLIHFPKEDETTNRQL